MSLPDLSPMTDDRKGGRGKCSVCGEVVNNVSYHESQCEVCYICKSTPTKATSFKRFCSRCGNSGVQYVEPPVHVTVQLTASAELCGCHGDSGWKDCRFVNLKGEPICDLFREPLACIGPALTPPFKRCQKCRDSQGKTIFAPVAEG